MRSDAYRNGGVTDRKTVAIILTALLTAPAPQRISYILHRPLSLRGERGTGRTPVLPRGASHIYGKKEESPMAMIVIVSLLEGGLLN